MCSIGKNVICTLERLTVSNDQIKKNVLRHATVLLQKKEEEMAVHTYLLYNDFEKKKRKSAEKLHACVLNA